LWWDWCLHCGGIGAFIISRYGYNLGLVDKPNERSSHDKDTPKGGGIGILISFILVSLILNIPFFFWIPATILALISFWGDNHDISPHIRLIIQCGASFVFLAGLSVTQHHTIIYYILIFPIAIFIVGTSNFYNFMDGINGIAGITGIIAFGLLAYWGYVFNLETPFIKLSICILLSCIAFLPFNFPRAKVFLGDVGAILLGFTFASFVVLFSKNFHDFIILSSFLFPFYADELTTMWIRFRKGQKFFHPHRLHLYQLLVNEMGIAHWKISILYGLFQLIIGISLIKIRHLGLDLTIFIICIFTLLFFWITFFVRRKVQSICSVGSKTNH